MAHQIQADYERLDQVALRFTRQAEKTQQLIQQVQKNMGRLQQSWEGVAASAFLSEMHGTLLPGIKRLQQAFSQSAQTVTRIATVMSEAENTAAALFKASETTPAASTTTAYGGGYGDGATDVATALNSDTTSYSGQEDDREPTPHLSAAQTAALAEMGITIEDLAGASPTKIQHAIDFLNDSSRISNPILDEGTYTGAQLVEAVATLEKLSNAGIELGQSGTDRTPSTWSIEEIAQMAGVIETMADEATRTFIDIYGTTALTELASYYDLPAKQAHYAPLMALLDIDYETNEAGEQVLSTFDQLRDGKNDVSYGAGNGGWFARYNTTDRSVTFGNRVFDGTEANSFTDNSVIAHEFSHRIAHDVDDENFAYDAFVTASDDNVSAGGTYDNAGYEYRPRTSESAPEQTADLFANGLLGSFTDSADGIERQGDFEAVFENIIDRNNPVPANYSADSQYTLDVLASLETQGLWTPAPVPPSAVPWAAPYLEA